MNQRFLQSVLLDDLVVLQVRGADATSFLQSQLSQNISDDNTSEAVFAAYCSPKGRVLATMVVVPQQRENTRTWALILKASGIDAIEKRLRMFVLRAKVEIERLDQAVYGVLAAPSEDRKSTRLNSSHVSISYAVFCLKK